MWNSMREFSHFLGLAVGFAAVLTVTIGPPDVRAKEIMRSAQAARRAAAVEVEAILLFSLFGLLVFCALLPFMDSAAACALMLAG
jgi:hypothetical protein